MWDSLGRKKKTTANLMKYPHLTGDKTTEERNILNYATGLPLTEVRTQETSRLATCFLPQLKTGEDCR